MTDIIIDAGTLTASRDDRIVTGLVLPYGEECRSNLGRFSVHPGTFTIPADVPGTVGFNVEHRREASVGRGVTMLETPAGVVGTFSIARTPEGDQVLDEIAAGTRRHLSVEASGIKIKAGRAIAGRIFGVAVVSEPAFPSATLLASAADTEPLDEQPEVAVTVNDSRPTVRVGEPAPGTNPPHTDEPDQEPDEDDTEEPADEPDDDDTEETENDVPSTATAPNNLHAARAAAPRRNTLDLSNLNTLMASARRMRGDRDFMGRLAEAGDAGGNLFAALTDITIGDGAGGANSAPQLPQYIGDLWSAVAYQRRYVPLVLAGALTSLKISGWRWKTGPAVAPWEGDKTAVPSPPVETEPYDVTAARLAGAYDVGREYRDFDVPGFWESFWAAMTASYARQSDDAALADLAASATVVPSDNTDLIGKVLAGIISISPYGTAAYAVADPALFVSVLTQTANNAPAFVAAGPVSFPVFGPSINIAGIPVIPGAVPAGSVLVGAREAATFYELPGSPIRVEGVYDMARGGEDPGLFGYYATVINQPAALALVGEPAAGGTRTTRSTTSK